MSHITIGTLSSAGALEERALQGIAARRAPPLSRRCERHRRYAHCAQWHLILAIAIYTVPAKCLLRVHTGPLYGDSDDLIFLCTDSLSSD